MAAPVAESALPSRGSFWVGRNRVPPAVDIPPAESTQNNDTQPNATQEQPQPHLSNFSILNPLTWRNA